MEEIPPRRHLQRPADLKIDGNGVSFKYKDYRLERSDRYKVMTLATEAAIR